eukprot:724342-Rhodomonas_salina.1
MAQEMEKANLIDEMMQEAFDDMEPESLQEESDLEVQKVLDELTGSISLVTFRRIRCAISGAQNRLLSTSTGTQVGAMKVAPTAVPVRPQVDLPHPRLSASRWPRLTRVSSGRGSAGSRGRGG